MGGTREEVIQKYRRWLWEQIKESRETSRDNPVTTALKDLVEKVKAGETVTLTCWCSPLPCHGDVIVSAVKWLITDNC